MPLEPVVRQSLPGAVFDQLVAGIVAGDLAAGSSLPSERDLAEALGVSRPAVREALQRLAQSGLVATRQGEGTTVRAWERTAGPDLLPALLLGADGDVDLRVARSVIEARAAIGPVAASLAAQRATPAVDQTLARHVARLAASDDAIDQQRIALDFWDAVIDASDNIAFRLMLNALTAAYAPLMDALAVLMAPEVSDTPAFDTLAAAIARRDAGTALVAAQALLEPGTTRLVDAIDELLRAKEATQ